MERSLCKKSQYVGKSEYSLNLRINTLRNVWRTENPPCDKHFQVPGHNFNAHAKFTINEEVYNKPLSKLKIRSHREDREDRTQRRFFDFEIENSFPTISKHIT